MACPWWIDADYSHCLHLSPSFSQAGLWARHLHLCVHSHLQRYIMLMWNFLLVLYRWWYCVFLLIFIMGSSSAVTFIVSSHHFLYLLYGASYFRKKSVYTQRIQGTAAMHVAIKNTMNEKDLRLNYCYPSVNGFILSLDLYWYTTGQILSNYPLLKLALTDRWHLQNINSYPTSCGFWFGFVLFLQSLISLLLSM